MKKPRSLSIIKQDVGAGQAPISGDVLAEDENKAFAKNQDMGGHVDESNVKKDLIEHVLLSLLGVVLIGFALATAMITHFAKNNPKYPDGAIPMPVDAYFSALMVYGAEFAEVAILAGGIATTVTLTVGLVLKSVMKLMEDTLTSWRKLKNRYYSKSL